MRIIILLTLILSLCTYSQYSNAQIIKKKTEFRYSLGYNKKTHEQKKSGAKKFKKGYTKYSVNGNIIEEAEYGERFYFRHVTKNTDSSISVTSGHGSYPKKLNTVEYKSYNDSNQIVVDEKWRFKDNKKEELIYKTVFFYANNKLIKESEYDADGLIQRTKEYDTLLNVQTEDRLKTIYRPFVRIGGNSSDSVRYDSTGQIIEQIHYYNGKFLYREEFYYGDWGTLRTELRYDDEPDKLWCITEYWYDIVTKQLLRKFWKVINSSSERREEYIYNKKNILIRIETYNRKGLTGYTKYKYKYY